MAHNRKLVLGAVCLVKARIRNDISAMTQVRDELEPILMQAGWFPRAPFAWVGLVIRYGVRTEDQPHLERINKADGDLPVAIEVDTNRVLEIHEDPLQFESFLKAVALRCLISVAKKYQLPSEELTREQEASNAA